MTKRAVLLGLLGATLICGFAYMNDTLMNQARLRDSYMPIPVYGGLILFVLLINPLLFYISKRLFLSSKELTVIFVIVLVACCIPGTNLVRQLTNVLMLPHQYNNTETSWKTHGVIEMAPEHMLADVSQDEDKALKGFVNGLAKGKEHIAIKDVPWYAWTRTLSFWLPLFLTLCMALIGLSIVVHRQWADHEHLAYPIVTFTNSLLPEAGQVRSSIFSSKLFWWGAGIVFFIRLTAFLQVWTELKIGIPTGFNLTALTEIIPAMEKSGLRTVILNQSFLFSFIGIAYFLASDVAFSLGIGPLLYQMVCLILMGYGLSLGAPITGSNLAYIDLQRFMSVGAYLGLFLVLVYTGRHYYYHVFRGALFIPSKDRTEQQSVWGARIFMIFAAMFMLQILLVGLDWLLALLVTGSIIVAFLVLSRVVAETGLFFVHSHFFPYVLIWGIFGYSALGPKVMVIMVMLSTIFLIDTRGVIMPFMVNALKLLDLQKVKLVKPALFCGVAILIGLIVAIPVTLYFQYDRGYERTDQWASLCTPKIPFQNALSTKLRLEAQGKLEQANQVSGWQRFTHMAPNSPGLIGLGAAFLLVLLFSTIRLRWPKWPIHPVIFVFWDTYLALMVYVSFLAGWLVKIVITKYGGIKLYQRAKPFMLGLIAGEFALLILAMLFGFVYYVISGERPRYFHVFPF